MPKKTRNDTPSIPSGNEAALLPELGDREAWLLDGGRDLIRLALPKRKASEQFEISKRWFESLVGTYGEVFREERLTRSFLATLVSVALCHEYAENIRRIFSKEENKAVVRQSSGFRFVKLWGELEALEALLAETYYEAMTQRSDQRKNEELLPLKISTVEKCLTRLLENLASGVTFFLCEEPLLASLEKSVSFQGDFAKLLHAVRTASLYSRPLSGVASATDLICQNLNIQT